MKFLDYISPLWDTMKGILPLSAALVFMQVVIMRGLCQMVLVDENRRYD